MRTRKCRAEHCRRRIASSLVREAVLLEFLGLPETERLMNSDLREALD